MRLVIIGGVCRLGRLLRGCEVAARFALMRLVMVAVVACGGAASSLTLLAGCRTTSGPAAVTAAPVRGATPVAPASARSSDAKSLAASPTGAAAESAQDCRRCNGVWAPHGISTTPSCNCRTRDGGKRCRDGADCEGACVAADEPEREVVTPGPPPRGYFVGRCSEVATVFGCSRFIDRGASARGPVALDDPPPQMCVD